MFPHDDPEFRQLLGIVATHRRLSVGLVEKDYWVTHALWALCGDANLEVWFKGGTSLSKGFGLIHRFSEDLDLRIDSVAAGAEGTAWPKKPTKAQVATRVAYFSALEGKLTIPGTVISTMEIDPDGRGGDFKVAYPGQFTSTVLPPNSPFVKLEVGRALVTPSVERTVSSFVHELLEERDQLRSYTDNRAFGVRCVHPRITLVEKLDAIAVRFDRGRQPSDYIRHYEDAARIIEAEDKLPELEESLATTVRRMEPSLRLKRIAPAEHPAFGKATARDPELRSAYAAIAPMFWASRMTLDDACEIIREWLRRFSEPA